MPGDVVEYDGQTLKNRVNFHNTDLTERGTMVIKSLELSNFGNYSLLNLSFDRGTEYLYAITAQGKTNDH